MIVLFIVVLSITIFIVKIHYMGSVTNLKENKTLFMICDDKNQVLVIDYDHKICTANLAMYQNITTCSYKLSFWQKILYCYRILVKGIPWVDNVLIGTNQLLDLRYFLNSLELKNK